MSDYRTIVVGDIHGCLAELHTLLKKCNYDPKHDRLLCLGDLIDRGPDVRDVLDFVMNVEEQQESSATIIGNHEMNALKALEHKGPRAFCERLGISDWDVTSKYAEWFKNMSFIEFGQLPNEKQIVYVHGGIHPDRNIGEQRKGIAARIQLVNKKTREIAYIFDIKKQSFSEHRQNEEDWVFWGELYNRPQVVVFGHTYFESIPQGGDIYALDGGACFGGELRALIVPTMEVVTVQSNVAVPGSDRAGRDYALFRDCKFY